MKFAGGGGVWEGRIGLAFGVYIVEIFIVRVRVRKLSWRFEKGGGLE